ncbi:MAG: DUF695 domain-containing protein [Gemmataceae bacterium]|nr:DUF695 domain-containing protein [Gemmataceae bacterium]
MSDDHSHAHDCGDDCGHDHHDHEAARAAFWDWFAGNGDRLRAAVYGPDEAAREAAYSELRDAAENAGEDLVLEIGRPPADGPGLLVVSADGRPDRVDGVKAFAASAPDLPGWEVVAFRPRDTMDGFVIDIQGERVGPDDIRFAVAPDPDGLALTLFVAGLTPENERVRGLGASLLAQHAVGERDALTLLSGVRTEPPPANPAGLRPFAELPGVLAAAREERYPPPGRLDPADEWATGQGTIGGKPAILLLRTGLRPLAGHPLYDRRLTVSLPFTNVGPEGMPADGDEFQAASDAGDGIAEALEAGQQSLHAFTVTGHGRRDVVFYTADPDGALDRLAAARAEGLGFAVEAEVEWDTYWGAYRAFADAGDGGDEEGGDEPGEGEDE